MYVHREKQLFLSVYVDDLKMAGKKENMKPMWDAMREHVELEPPKKMWENQYLVGCSQKPLIPAEEDIEKMGAAFENFSVKRGDCAARAAHPDPLKTGPDKVLDEKGSSKVIREGTTSRGIF